MSKGWPLLQVYNLVPLSICGWWSDWTWELKEGVLYVNKPVFQKVWVPLHKAIISKFARATATMLQFFGQLREECNAVLKASWIVITQFRHILIEMGVVQNIKAFIIIEDGCMQCVVSRVFVPDHLPSQTSTRPSLLWTYLTQSS